MILPLFLCVFWELELARSSFYILDDIFFVRSIALTVITLFVVFDQSSLLQVKAKAVTAFLTVDIITLSVSSFALNSHLNPLIFQVSTRASVGWVLSTLHLLEDSTR